MDSSLISTIAFIISIAALLMAAWMYWNTKKSVYALKETQKLFFKGKTGKDLEEVLMEIVRKVNENENENKILKQENNSLHESIKDCFSNIGIIRFNPFNDTGSNQSFVIALLNDNNNGFIITSLYTRQGTSIYAKPIQKGASEFSLTEEEQLAIQKART